MSNKKLRKSIIGICLNCGQSFMRIYKKRLELYCSRQRYLDQKIRKGNTSSICVYCKQKYNHYTSQKRLYCSKQCATNHAKETWMNSVEYKQFISDLHTGRIRPKETGQRISEAQKKVWQNRSEEEKRILAQKIRESVVNLYKQGVYSETYPHELPSGLERKFIAIIEKYQLPFRYVGDFQVWIEWMNPDFIHFTEPIVIEIQSNSWHNKKETKERVEKFSVAGYLCIPIWENELKNEDLVIDKLNSFGFMNINKVVNDNEISVENL